MYHPQHDREQERRMHRSQQGAFVHILRGALLVLTVVFWVAASICVAAIAMSKFTESIGVWLFWVIGVSLLVVAVSSGAIAWIDFRSTTREDPESGYWTGTFFSMASSSPSRSL
jgi:predicted phage tail protein